MKTMAALLFNNTPPPNFKISQDTLEDVTAGYAPSLIDSSVKGDLLHSEDLAAKAKYDFTGARKHVWFGQASNLVGRGTSLSLAERCLRIADVQEKKARAWLANHLQSYFAPVRDDSLACVFVNVGHVRWGKTLADNKLRYVPHQTEDKEEVTQESLRLGQVMLKLPTTPSKFSIIVPEVPLQMVSPAGPRDVVIRKRKVVKTFMIGNARDSQRDFMLQFGPGDASPTGYGQFCGERKNQGYFQNTEDIRRAGNEIKFTDTTGLNLVRIVHHGKDAHEYPMVHHTIINLNAGVNGGSLRKDRIRGIEHNPDQMLNYDIVVTPLLRFMRLYEDLFQLLHERMFSTY